MANPSPAVSGARPAAGLSAFALLAEGFRQVAARWRPALGLWAAGALLSAAPRFLRTLTYAPPATWSPGWDAQLLLLSAASAMLAALTLRFFLTKGRDWLTPDRGFWICVGLLMAANLGTSVADLLAMGNLRHSDRATLAFRATGSLALPLVIGWFYVRLMLWPIGALAGDAGMTPGRSWRAMRGQTAGFFVAVIAAELPSFLLAAVYPFVAADLLRQWPGLVTPGYWMIGVVLTPAAHVLERAMAASVYRARIG